MEIDLRELFMILRKRWILIVSVTLLAIFISGIISFYIITPVYQSSTELLVNKSEAEANSIYSYNDIQTTLKLIETYRVIIKSPRIIDVVIDRYNLDYSSQQLTSKIQVNSVKDSQVLAITVQDSDQAKAAMLANAVAETFRTEVVKIMRVDNVQVLTEAKVIENPNPIKPKPMLNIAIAFVLGMMIAVGLVFLLEYLDNTIKSEAEVERLLGYPVLGSIATIKGYENNKRKIVSKNLVAFNQRGEGNEI